MQYHYGLILFIDQLIRVFVDKYFVVFYYFLYEYTFCKILISKMYFEFKYKRSTIRLFLLITRVKQNL